MQPAGLMPLGPTGSEEFAACTRYRLLLAPPASVHLFVAPCRRAGGQQEIRPAAGGGPTESDGTGAQRSDEGGGSPRHLPRVPALANSVDIPPVFTEDVPGEVHAEPPSAFPRRAARRRQRGHKSSYRWSGPLRAELLGSARLELEDRMTAKKHFKSLVRRRAAKTGESYTAALRHFRTNRQEEPAMGSMKAATANCSFCGKPNTEVRKLIAGPGVKICDQCIILCNEVIAEVDDAPDSLRGSKEPSTERLLTWLPSIAETLRSVEAEIVAKVAELRDNDVPWPRIAQALRMSESEAAERFGSRT